jgi:hypothetical protein
MSDMEAPSTKYSPQLEALPDRSMEERTGNTKGIPMQLEQGVGIPTEMQCLACQQLCPADTVKCSHCGGHHFRSLPDSTAGNSVTTASASAGPDAPRAALTKLIERLRGPEWRWTQGKYGTKYVYVRPGELPENIAYARDADSAGYLVLSHGLQVDEILHEAQAILDGAE